MAETFFNYDAWWSERASAPDTPGTSFWKLFPKSDGFYSLDDAGAALRLLTSADLSGLGAASATSLALTGTAGAGYVKLPEQSAAPTFAANHVLWYADASNRPAWIGENNKTVAFDATANAANAVYTLPPTTATLAVKATTANLFLSAAGGWQSVTNGCAPSTKNQTATNKLNYYSLNFDAAVIEYAEWNFAMPPQWDGTITAFAVHWTAASGSGDVVWTLQGRAYANDDPLDAAWGTGVDVTDTLTAAGDLDISPAGGAVTLAGSPAGGQYAAFRLSRKASDGAVTLAVDAMLLGVTVTYGVNA